MAGGAREEAALPRKLASFLSWLLVASILQRVSASLPLLVREAEKVWCLQREGVCARWPVCLKGHPDVC